MEQRHVLFSVGTFMADLLQLSPKIMAAAQEAWVNAVKKEPIEPLEDDMRAIPSISIDFALMEKNSRVACVTCNLGWSDLGSFDALYGHLHMDVLGLPVSNTSANVVSCGAELVVLNSRKNLVISLMRTVPQIGVGDKIVAANDDILLIANRGSSYKVKEDVEVLKAQESELAEVFLRLGFQGATTSNSMRSKASR